MPIYEVKPMKKGTKKTLESSDSRNKLEVNAADLKKTKVKESHHRSKEQQKTHKTREHKSRDREQKGKEGGDVEKTKVVDGTKEKEQKVKKVVVKEKQRVLHEDKAGIGREVTKYGRDLKRNVKPPVVLVYADSAIAKDGVKQVLHEILNREKYANKVLFWIYCFYCF